MKKFLEFCIILLLNELASSSPQNQNYDRRQLSYRNGTSTRSRKIDGHDRRQTGVSGDMIAINRNDGCNEIFCENSSDPEYPKSYIQSSNLEKFEHLFTVDYEDKIQQRNGFDDGEGLCQSRRRTTFPTRAKSKNGEWLTIVNDDGRYRQGILIEECSRPYSRCDYADLFPNGKHAICKQSFIYRTLVALSDNNTPIVEHFQFPSCCKCFIMSGRISSNPDPNPIRFGGSGESKEEDRSTSSGPIWPA